MERVIAAERARVGMSQRELAEHLGVSKATMSRWEANPMAMSAESLYRVVDLFGVTVDYLTGRSEVRKAVS